MKVLRRKRFAILMLLAALTCCSCLRERGPDVPSLRYLDGPPTVRVMVAEDSGKIWLAIPEGCWVIRGGKVLKAKSDQPAVVTARRNRVLIGDNDTGSRVITMVAPQGSSILVNGKSYPDQISLMAGKDKISAVNTVDIEAYVAGVVAGEMPLEWDDDALCAQAVAARTYALHEKKKWASERAFDLYADERSQVYTGATREDKALRAASSTRGVVLMTQYQIFPAYYHSACGGRTRKAFPDFDPRRLTPLVGVECPFCAFKDTKWEIAFEGEELRTRLGMTREIREIEVIDSRDGVAVAVSHEKGGTRFTVGEFRRRLDPRKLRSWRFDVHRSGGKWVFSGRGFGHGVGMCQWGACGMAREGYAWPSILRHYYPGAEAVRVY